MNKKLSVIISTCLEWPQVVFTVRNIAEELRDRADFEIIVVDNFCDEVAKQAGGKEDDGTREHLKAVMRGNPWLKVLHYTDKLSHWQAKNMGVKHASGDILWFCDAHCIVSRDALYNMHKWFTVCEELYSGQASLHLPLTYHIMEYHKLIYKLVVDLPKGWLGYSFTGFTPSDESNSMKEVPAMSTCGMMISKKLYNDLGGWPSELGIYGGGENFINFTMAVLGKKKYIYGELPLFHHGAKRGYHWNYTDHKRNQCIAAYMYGGREFALRFMQNCKGDTVFLKQLAEKMFPMQKKHREHIKRQMVMSIEEWVGTMI